MSDLQILTGFSILVSGFAQLSNSLQCYHYQVIIQLAWFSSLCHLTCLTFLRNYLYNRPGERTWRLLSMGLLIGMLTVGMVPTGAYDWAGFCKSSPQSKPAPFDFAIEYFNIPDFNTDYRKAHLTKYTMIISIFLLVVGFLIRVIRLFEFLSKNVIGQGRDMVSVWARQGLCWVYNRCHIPHSSYGIRRQFCYRPLLAIFLLVRVMSDTWASMFLEVSSLFALDTNEERF